LKSVTKLYLAVSALVMLCLSSVGLAQWSDHRWLWFAGSVITAAGVIVLAWHCAKLASGIVSTVEGLSRYGTGLRVYREKSDPQDPPPSDSPRTSGFSLMLPRRLTSELSKAVNRCFEACARDNHALTQKVEDLQLQIQLAERQKRNTEAIIYSIRDAVIVVDEFDRVLMSNDAAGKLFHFDFRNCVHKPLAELVDESKSEFVDFVRHCRKGKARAARQELQFVEQDRPRTFDCITSCVYDDKDRACGVVAVLHDITREKEISQLKNDFVSHVSHELKTPLASITAYSEMLCEGEADDEKTRKEFYAVIQSQAQRLNRLIEDILNISRIESGLIKVDKRPVSLTLLIEEQLQMIRGYAEEKNIEVTGQRPIVFDQVNVDKDMISQVIVNLLSNAVKYTPAGGKVKIETEVDEIAQTVRLSVADTGVGIPEDEVEHVFDKFYRVSANKTQAKGTGLGLNLVKQIVENVHRGRVFVKSKPGEGSTFGFELPLAKAETVRAL